jgi:hypothetical protein
MENQIKTLLLTAKNYTKAIELGYYEPIKCISVFVKLVTHYKACGRTEEILVTIKNK